ncbi:hypothetical protein OA098_01745 [Prochlorococcus sp. AH-736-B04]|nr:hypothetical protein [Prochlorococcus sp. AH-736-B04]
MKRLLLPKNKFARVSINVAFIVIWEELAGLIIEIIWETIGELEFFNQDSFLVLLIEILFLILPILSLTYWIWWGKNLMSKKIK